jgi:hypothetical protein
MKLNRRGNWIVRSVFIVVFALVGVAVFAWRNSTIRAQAQHTPVHMTTDWSNRHVVFSAPTDAEQLKKLQSDPRFVQQQMARQNAAPGQVKP